MMTNTLDIKPTGNDCPCCYRPMIRHIRHHQTVWFCRHCWQEMPTFVTSDFPAAFLGLRSIQQLVELSNDKQLDVA
jgi:ribosomal protein L37AE/L43A